MKAPVQHKCQWPTGCATEMETFPWLRRTPEGTTIEVCDFHRSTAFPSRYGREGDTQGLPIQNDLDDVQSAVIADIEVRRLIGIERYGTALQPHNGRDAVQDLYEELLDAAMYAKQLLLEREDNAERNVSE